MKACLHTGIGRPLAQAMSDPIAAAAGLGDSHSEVSVTDLVARRTDPASNDYDGMAASVGQNNLRRRIGAEVSCCRTGTDAGGTATQPAVGLPWCPCSVVERLQQICDLADRRNPACR
jgi:hypothetical protein